MTRIIAFSVLLSLCYTSSTGQVVSSFPEFMQRVDRHEPAAVFIDTTAKAFFVSQENPISYYFETFRHEEQWFFLWYKEQFEYGSQALCQCDYDQLQAMFTGISKHIAEGNFLSSAILSNDLVPEDFYTRQCLVAGGLPPFKPQAPLIEKLLNGNIPPPANPGDTVPSELSAQLLLREDGQWLLDLEGKIPDDLQLLEPLTPQLYYLRSANKSYYPSPEVAPWRKTLLERGHYTQSLIGYTYQDWHEDLGRHRVLPVEKSEQAWNIQFMLPADDTLPSGKLEAAGTIDLLVSDGSTKTVAQSTTHFKAGTTYELEHNGEATVYVREANQEVRMISGLAYFPDSYWQRVVFYEENGDTVARFTYHQDPSTVTFTPKPGKTYGVELTSLNRRTIKVPFQLQLSGNELQPKFELGQLHSQRYSFDIARSDPFFISATYDLYAPLHSSQDSFILNAAYDDTGKDLLSAQKDSIDNYNAWIASLGENRNWWDSPLPEYWKNGFNWSEHEDGQPRPHYHLEIGLADQPAPEATAIYLEGTIHYQDAYGKWQMAAWQDTLKMGIPGPVTPAELIEPIKPKNELSFISASSFRLGDAYAGNKQGLEARFFLPVPYEHSYVQLDQKRSQILNWQDNLGYNLLQLDQEMKAWNQSRKKRMLNPSSSEYKNLRSLSSVYKQGIPLDHAGFSVHTRSTPTLGATQVTGRAKIVYDCVAKQDIRPNTQTIKYNQQESIMLEIDGHFANYQRSPFTSELGDQVFVKYELQQEDLGVIIVATAVMDGDEVVSPDLDQVNDYYNIYLPEDWKDRSFTLRVLYGELHQHEENIDLETSISGAIHH